MPTDDVLLATRDRIREELALNTSRIVVEGILLQGSGRRRVLSGAFDDISDLDATLGKLNTSSCSYNATDGVVLVQLQLKGTSRSEYDALVLAIQQGILDLKPETTVPTYVECAGTQLLSVGGGAPAPPPPSRLPDDNDGLSTGALVGIIAGSAAVALSAMGGVFLLLLPSRSAARERVSSMVRYKSVRDVRRVAEGVHDWTIAF